VFFCSFLIYRPARRWRASSLTEGKFFLSQTILSTLVWIQLAAAMVNAFILEREDNLFVNLCKIIVEKKQGVLSDSDNDKQDGVVFDDLKCKSMLDDANFQIGIIEGEELHHALGSCERVSSPNLVRLNPMLLINVAKLERSESGWLTCSMLDDQLALEQDAQQQKRARFGATAGSGDDEDQKSEIKDELLHGIFQCCNPVSWAQKMPIQQVLCAVLLFAKTLHELTHLLHYSCCEWLKANFDAFASLNISYTTPPRKFRGGVYSDLGNMMELGLFGGILVPYYNNKSRIQARYAIKKHGRSQ